MAGLTWRKSGTGRTYLVDGLYAPGVTTVNNAALAKGGLVPWATKACANEVLNRWEELLGLTPSERFELVRSAPERDRDEAARRGTEVHLLARTVGHDPRVAPDHGQQAQWSLVLDAHRPRRVHERPQQEGSPSPRAVQQPDDRVHARRIVDARTWNRAS